MKNFTRAQSRHFQRKGLRLFSSRPLIAIMLIALAAIFYYWPALLNTHSGQPAETLGRDTFSGRVFRVADGDSLEINNSGRTIKIRLYGMDAPELNQPHGSEARDWLADRILNKTVKVETIDIDQYNRVVGLVFLEESLINQAAVMAGQAWVYKQYCTIGLCDQMNKNENEARRSGLGLWGKAAPTPPWLWRRSNPARKK